MRFFIDFTLVPEAIRPGIIKLWAEKLEKEGYKSEYKLDEVLYIRDGNNKFLNSGKMEHSYDYFRPSYDRVYHPINDFDKKFTMTVDSLEVGESFYVYNIKFTKTDVKVEDRWYCYTEKSELKLVYGDTEV